MKFARKVIVAVNLVNNMEALYKPLKEMDFLKECEVHFVHVFPSLSYADTLMDMPFLYPSEEERTMIQQSVIAKLNHLADTYFPMPAKGKIHCRCLFSENPKKKFCEYVSEQKADLVIVASGKKHGFFESSFAAYVNKHTEQHLILIKNK